MTAPPGSGHATSQQGGRPEAGRGRGRGAGDPGEGMLARRVAVRPGLAFSRPLLRGSAELHLVRLPDGGRTLELGARERFVIDRLDGTRTLGAVGEEYASHFGRRLGEAQWGQLLGLLYKRGLLAGIPADDPSVAPPPEPERVRSTLLHGSVRLVSDAAATAARLHRVLRPLLSAWCQVPLLLLCLVMEVLLLRDLGTVVSGTGEMFRQPMSLLVVASLLWLSTALHELAHAVAAHRYGGEVTEIGLRWRLPVMIMYCTVGNYHFLGRRRHQIITAGAGAHLNLVYLLPFFAVWTTLSDGGTKDALSGLLLLGSVQAWIMFVPVPPMDGYTMLSHATGVTEYAGQSGRYVRLALRRNPAARGYPRRARRAYAGYVLGWVVVLLGLLAGVAIGCYRLWGDDHGVAAAVVPVLVLVALGAATAFGRSRRAAATPQAPPPTAPPATPQQVVVHDSGREHHAHRARHRRPGPPDERGGPAPQGRHARRVDRTEGPAGGTAATTGAWHPVGARVGGRPLDGPPPVGQPPAGVPPVGAQPVGAQPVGAQPVGARNSGVQHSGEKRTTVTTEPVAITLHGVRKRYERVQAVDQVSLTVSRGEFFGLLGPNGAGKTTLVEIMEGLRQADEGTVSVLGEPPWPRNTRLLPRVGVQTQSSAFFVRLTAVEHLRTVAALYGVGDAAVWRTLASVGLTEHADNRVDALSGGQRQRLAIASALVHDPELIFLDEPTAALDPQARRALWQVLRGLKSAGRTIVYTTHHLDEAEALCDRVAIMVGGSVVALDTPNQLVGAAKAPTRLLVPAHRFSVAMALSIAGVERASEEGGSVVIETRHAGPVLSEVGRIAGFDGVQTRTATLEDVYLELTGSAHE